MTGHPTDGAPDTLMVKLCNQSYQSNLGAEIGSQWGNCSRSEPTSLGHRSTHTALHAPHVYPEAPDIIMMIAHSGVC